MTSQFADPKEKRQAIRILALNTFAFTVCFAVWMMNGVLITFLNEHGVHSWDPSEIGWMIGVPVLTGAIFRLPMGILTDKYGGRIVYGLLLLFCTVPTFMLSYCDTYTSFFFASLGFGFCGTSFAVGIAYTSVWFPKGLQGTALGIFGAGNAGAALTSLGAPRLLNYLTDNGKNIEGWRTMPRIYAGVLLVTGIAFLIFTKTRLAPGSAHKTLGERLQPLKQVRVWRFGLYYFFVFGGFVALAQWLIPYYVNAYSMTVAMAGMLAASNSLPSGVIRAAGGWLSDKYGARRVMYYVFGICLVCCALLVVPQMDIRAPGSGVMTLTGGTVTKSTPGEIIVKDKFGRIKKYKLKVKKGKLVTKREREKGLLVLPRSQSWQERESSIKVGTKVKKKQLVARGVTQVFFQANVWIFTFLSFLIGAVMGIGKAGVYKWIPQYFPDDVGVVGGIVGVLGGLGGFVCPVIFGYLLKWTGLWTTCWMFFFVLTAVCMIWMHSVVRKMMKKKAAHLVDLIEEQPNGVVAAPAADAEKS